MMKAQPPKAKFKKAPQAPRRFKSAYMFYSTLKHKEIREQLSKQQVRVGSLATHCGFKMKEIYRADLPDTM
jgi:hypothetical protein